MTFLALDFNLQPSAACPMLATTLFFTLLTNSISALPPIPKASLPTFNIITTPTPPNTTLTNSHIDCFESSSDVVFPLDPDDCNNAIDILFHDPTGVMNMQTFSYHAEKGGFGTPADWHAGHCQILLTSGLEDIVDRFRLVDVIVEAKRILEECPPKSKMSLGGLALVGNMKGFFVALNGPGPGVGNGNGTGVWGEG